MALVLLAFFGLSAAPASASTTTPTSRPQAPAAQRAPGSVLTVTADNSRDGKHEFYRLNTHRLRAGLVTVRLHNTGTVAHQVQFIRLHKGITPARYRADLIRSGGGTALTEGDAAGGATAIEPGARQVAWVNLRAGTYVAVCFQDGGDARVPHFVHGMYDSFTVVGQHPRFSSPGHVKGTIRGFSFGYTIPKVVDGHAIYRFVDVARTDTHELQLLKLKSGATAADVLAWIKRGQTGRSPVSGTAGGAGAIPPGGQDWAQFNLRPGHYVAVCFVPDDQPPHKPHAALGMVRGFTVK